MRTSDKIYREVRRLAIMEALATGPSQGRAGLEEFDKTAARADLLPLLREAAGLRDIDLLLNLGLQRHALAVSEIREPAKPYKPERKFRLAA